MARLSCAVGFGTLLLLFAGGCGRGCPHWRHEVHEGRTENGSKIELRADRNIGTQKINWPPEIVVTEPDGTIIRIRPDPLEREPNRYEVTVQSVGADPKVLGLKLVSTAESVADPEK